MPISLDLKSLVSPHPYFASIVRLINFGDHNGRFRMTDHRYNTRQSVRQTNNEEDVVGATRHLINVSQMASSSGTLRTEGQQKILETSGGQSAGINTPPRIHSRGLNSRE